jgi:hypothetical protein
LDHYIQCKKQPVQKIKTSFKPGKKRNANGRYVKIKTAKQSKTEKPKSKTLKTKQPYKPGKARNADGRCVKIKTIKKQVPLEFVELSLSPDSNPVQILSFLIPVPILKQKINIRANLEKREFKW